MSEPSVVEAVCASCGAGKATLVVAGLESDEVRCAACGFAFFWESPRAAKVERVEAAWLLGTVNRLVESGARPDVERLRELQLRWIAAAGGRPELGGRLRSDLRSDRYSRGRDIARRGPDGGLWLFAVPEDVPRHLRELTESHEADAGRAHPIELAARWYQMLLRIRPFADGNVAAAGLFLDFMLQSHGYVPASLDLACDPVHSPTATVVSSVAWAVAAASERVKRAR